MSLSVIFICIFKGILITYSFEYDPLERLANSRHYLNATLANNLEEKDIYDLNSNMTYDATSGLTMEWNDLNLIKKVSDGNGMLVNYSYLADGTKVRAVDADGEGLEYQGSLTFRRSQDGSTGQVVETNDYYAFGSRWDRSGSLIDQSNRYRYNGKEEQTTFGTPYSDYGARQYSSASGRWLAVDPLAEKYYSISPYAFCNNNPVNFVDHDGKAIDIIADVVSIGCGIYNLAQNIKAGNTKAAWGDVAGIGLDLVCAVIPGVTINAGTAKTLAKSSAEIIDEVVDAKGAWSLNPFDRGKSIEKTLQGWGDNYPVIDFYNRDTKTATSIKSLDLNAKSYKSGNAVFNRVKGYIDDLVKFEGKMTPQHPVPVGGIENRVLELAIPDGATQNQLDQLRRLIDYAQQNNVQLNIVLAK